MPTDDQPTLDELHRAMAGDTHALEGLLRAHYSRLLQYVQRHMPGELQPDYDPDDVAQETVINACRMIHGFRPAGEDSFFRWLAAIARNHLVDLLRMHRSCPSLAHGQHFEAMPANCPIPSRSAAGHEFRAAVERSLDRLPADHRQVLQLRLFGGLSTAQTATRIHRTPKAISSLYVRAMQALREVAPPPDTLD